MAKSSESEPTASGISLDARQNRPLRGIALTVIGIGCITAYFNDEMLLVTCRSSIIKHYANGPLFGDLIAAIPLLSVCRWTALPQSVTILKLGKFLGFLGPKKGGILPGKSALFKNPYENTWISIFGYELNEFYGEVTANVTVRFIQASSSQIHS